MDYNDGNDDQDKTQTSHSGHNEKNLRRVESEDFSETKVLIPETESVSIKSGI